MLWSSQSELTGTATRGLVKGQRRRVEGRVSVDPLRGDVEVPTHYAEACGNTAGQGCVVFNRPLPRRLSANIEAGRLCQTLPEGDFSRKAGVGTWK